jgi:hypothetical protein
MSDTTFTGTVFLDNVLVVAKEIQNTWVEYNGDVYYVFYVDMYDKEITLFGKTGGMSIGVMTSDDISFKSVQQEVYTGNVVYIGDETTEPTVMPVVKYKVGFHKPYRLENAQGEIITATSYEVEPIDF